jgi:hypothetical protein
MNPLEAAMNDKSSIIPALLMVSGLVWNTSNVKFQYAETLTRRLFFGSSVQAHENFEERS